MSELKERGKRFVKVKDSSGNEWLCPLDAIKKASVSTAELTEKEQGGKMDSEYIEQVLNEIKSIRKGALAPFFQQPALQSLLVPCVGIGGANLLDFLM